MILGHIRERANPFLVSFVFGCVCISVGLLYIMQHAEARGESLSSTDMYYTITFDNSSYHNASPLEKSR
jgi:hypothetical protein